MSYLDASVGTPQTAFAPNAAREESFARSFFYELGDLFGGTDTANRIPTNYGQPINIGVDDYGRAYVRGSTVTALPNTPTAPVATVPGFEITPGMILAGAVALFMYFNRGK